jgi:signal transduction histidine kinase
MSFITTRSLQLRLAVRLAATYLVATALAVGVLFYRAYETANTLNDRELSQRAADLASSVSLDDGASARLILPPKLDAAYRAAADSDIFAVRGPDGRMLGAVPPSFGALVAKWPTPTDDPTYFHLKDFGDGTRQYDGLSLAFDNPIGSVSVWVARTIDANALASSVLREFLVDIAWVIPLVVLITLVIGVWVVRGGLKPVRRISEMAAAIGPNATSVRLPEKGLPNEITPLVAAINRALDRLEQGFEVQRQFTANAAHELRTPLAIVTAALDAMHGNGELAKLKDDVRRMNRLVEQLLRVARLDALALDVSGSVNLHQAAEEVVANLAPWALAQERTLAFVGPDRAVWVRGNDHAVADAIRNLIENAITHSPPSTEILVAVSERGCASVADRGPGIPSADRLKIFERFWRGRVADSPGAGLGLSIVREIVKAHCGEVRVDDNPGGGSIFTLQFPLRDRLKAADENMRQTVA